MKLPRRVFFIIFLILATLITLPLFQADISGGNAAPLETQSLFLPAVFKNLSPISQFGVHTEFYNTNVFQKAEESNSYWMRMWAISWDMIEPTEGSYDWSSVPEWAFEQASQRGMQTIAVIQYAPDWAQLYQPWACGPIDSEDFQAFANFLYELVSRYSQPPYNVKYWELGNEPDVDRDGLGTSYRHNFGCWGEDTDEYYGGGYYADMLKVAYPAIKAADPGAQVVLGGLLLDCDYTHEDCKPSKFLDGILYNDGADYFDVVNFHGYPWWNGTLLVETNFIRWAHRDPPGLVEGKIDFLRWVMAQHSVSKPILLTEGSLMCPPWYGKCVPNVTESDPAYFEAQADYLVRLFTRTWAQGLLGTTWYMLNGPGWRDTGLLDASQNPRPSYYAFQYMSSKLEKANYKREVTDYSSYPVKAYEFITPSSYIWVMWSPDEIDHEITLPSNVGDVYDKYGVSYPIPANKKITVNHSIYVDLAR
jgi:hypothetical protein